MVTTCSLRPMRAVQRARFMRHHPVSSTGQALDRQPGGVGGETARLRDRRSLDILENPTCGRIYVMNIGRITAGINKAEDDGTAHGQIISTDALRRNFQMALAAGAPKC